MCPCNFSAGPTAVTVAWANPCGACKAERAGASEQELPGWAAQAGGPCKAAGVLAAHHAAVDAALQRLHCGPAGVLQGARQAVGQHIVVTRAQRRAARLLLLAPRRRLPRLLHLVVAACAGTRPVLRSRAAGSRVPAAGKGSGAALEAAGRAGRHRRCCSGLRQRGCHATDVVLAWSPAAWGAGAAECARGEEGRVLLGCTAALGQLAMLLNNTAALHTAWVGVLGGIVHPQRPVTWRPNSLRFAGAPSVELGRGQCAWRPARVTGASRRTQAARPSPRLPARPGQHTAGLTSHTVQAGTPSCRQRHCTRRGRPASGPRRAPRPPGGQAGACQGACPPPETLEQVRGRAVWLARPASNTAGAPAGGNARVRDRRACVRRLGSGSAQPSPPTPPHLQAVTRGGARSTAAAAAAWRRCSGTPRPRR